MSASLTAVASSLATGIYSAYESIRSAKVTSTIDSPAQSLSVVFAPQQNLGDLEYIKLYDKGNLLFSGKVDSQKTTLSKSGLTVEIHARSPGALLLDNQAMPGVMFCASVQNVYNYFITPHGFTFYNPNRNTIVGFFAVRSGMSEWDVLCDFARRAYGFTPYVVDTQIMLERRHGMPPLYISNSSYGHRYSSISRERTPYNIVSRIYYRGDDGFYRNYLDNTYPSAKNIRRRRYFIPSSEYSDLPYADAAARINRSMLDYDKVVLELPGAIPAELGQDVAIDNAIAGYTDHMVSKIEYIADKDGIITRLTIVNPLYYDRERR